jgi:hypothetical protein
LLANTVELEKDGGAGGAAEGNVDEPPNPVDMEGAILLLFVILLPDAVTENNEL